MQCATDGIFVQFSLQQSLKIMKSYVHEIPNAPSNNLGCKPGVKMSHVVLAVSLVRIEMHVLVVLV